MADIFQDRNMAGVTFRNVNLAGAEFRDVNLRDAVMRNANLAGLSIDDANIHGMTVFGFRIDKLTDAKLSQRDPQRLRLQIKHPQNLREVRRVITRLDNLRATFRRQLLRANPNALNQRREKNTWSALEHLRHLVFAEELYTNRWILRKKLPWSRLGLLPAFLRQRPGFKSVATKPTRDLNTILTVWERVHQRTHDFLKTATNKDLQTSTRDIDFGQGTVGAVLAGLATHDLHHIRKAQLSLRAAARPAKQNP